MRYEGLCPVISSNTSQDSLLLRESERDPCIGSLWRKEVPRHPHFDLTQFRPDADARVSVRSELGLTEDTPLVGLIARFDPQKNHSGFFKAAAWICRSRPDVHFLMARMGVDDSNVTLRQSTGVNAFGCDVFYGGGDRSAALESHLLESGIVRRMDGNVIPFDTTTIDFVTNKQDSGERREQLLPCCLYQSNS